MVQAAASRGLAAGQHTVTSGYERVTGLADLFARAGELAVKTMIFDIEPLVAPWNSSQQALDRGPAP